MLEKSREEKKEGKKDDNDYRERIRQKKVQAGSIEELIEKINEVDWSKVKSEELPQNGSRFECSI